MVRLIKHPIILYGFALAILVIGLRSLEYFYFVRTISTELYIVILVVGFTVLGIWMGRRISARGSSGVFKVNKKAIQSLGISPRELDVLNSLASGLSNEEIASSLNISLSTVKTHVSNLLVKLEVDNRVKAIKKAQMLHIVE